MSPIPPAALATPSTYEVKTFLSPFLFGGMVSSLLLGVLVVLTALYFRRFPHDPLLHRIITLLFLVASCLSWGTTLYLLDYAFIQNYAGTVLSLHAWPRVVVIPILLPAISALLSQVLFGVRVWKFSGKSWWIGTAILLLICSSAASGVLAMVVQPHSNKLGINGSDARFFEAMGIQGSLDAFRHTVLAAEVFLWISSITDCFISGTLAYQLLRQKAATKTALTKDVDTLLSRILVYGVMTGGATACYSVAMALTVLFTTSQNNLEIGLALQQTIVYGIVCVSSLNLRPLSAARQRSGSKGSNSSPRPSTSTTYTTRPRPRIATDGFDLSEKYPHPSRTSPRHCRWQGEEKMRCPKDEETIELVPGLRVQVRSATHVHVDGEEENQSPLLYLPHSPGSGSCGSPLSPGSLGSPITSPDPACLPSYYVLGKRT